MTTNEPTKYARPIPDANADPITGAHGAHPVATTLGAVGIGAAAGAGGGAIGGPVGAVVGAVAGAVVGGLAGKAVGEAIDPTVENTYWVERYPATPYADPKVSFEEYAPAYRYGWESYGSRGGKDRSFESVENDLQRGWDKAKGTSRLGWDKARSASKDAWNRVKNAANALASPA